MRDRKAIIIVVVVVVVVAGATLIASIIGGSTAANAAGGTTTSQTSGESAASSTVAAFGQTLQQVSIMAPNAANMIASTYAPYVSPSLLKQWEADPTSAPGRVVSSPWPDHIQITSVTQQGSGYVVDGTLVFMSSTGVNAATSIVAQVVDNNGTWQVAAFQNASPTQ